MAVLVLVLVLLLVRLQVKQLVLVRLQVKQLVLVLPLEWLQDLAGILELVLDLVAPRHATQNAAFRNAAPTRTRETQGLPQRDLRHACRHASWEHGTRDPGTHAENGIWARNAGNARSRHATL